MEHNYKSRPQLPGTTTTTLSSTRKSPYASASVENVLVNLSDREVTRRDFTEKSSQARLISKLIAKLPFELRESIGSAFDMIVQQSELAVRDCNLARQEVLSLQHELVMRSSDTANLEKICEVNRQKIRALEDNLDEMKDNMDSRQKYLVKNRRSVDRMASTNRMLIGSLESLQINSSAASAGGPASPDHSHHAADHAPASSEKSPSGTTTGMSDKLRESLLRVSREHYRSIKKVEVLEQTVDTLKSSLKSAEQKNRQLKLAIDELQSHHSDTHSPNQSMGMFAGFGAPPSSAPSGSAPTSSPALGNSVNWDLPSSAAAAAPRNNSRNSSRTFGKLDDKFQSLIAKQAIDPTEGLLVLRRLLAFVAAKPGSLQLVDAAQYLASRELLKIFEAELVCVFVIPGGDSNNVYHKYTPRSKEPEVIRMGDSNSLVAEVMATNQTIRINSMSRLPAQFNPDVDSCPGLQFGLKRVLSVPLYDYSKGRVIGAIQFLNKTRSGVVYSEADEIYAQIVADHATSLLSACLAHEQMDTRSTILTSLLDVSADIYNVVPDELAFDCSKELHPGDILRILETLSRSALKCTKTRAFLFTPSASSGPGELLLLSRRQPSSKHAIPSTQTVSAYSGVVGTCIRSRKWQQVEGNEMDSILNPEIDIDSTGLPMITVPVFNIHNKIIAIIQMVPGPHSPKLSLGIEDFGEQSGVISFHQATQWFLHQISHPLDYLLQYIGKTVQRPMSTPANLSSPLGQLSSQNFLSSQQEMLSLSSQEKGEDFESVPITSISLSIGLDLDQPRRASVTSRHEAHSPMSQNLSRRIAVLSRTLADVMKASDAGCISPRKGLAVEDAANALLESVRETNEQAVKMKADLHAAQVEAENSRIELQEASAGYARGIAQLDAQISEFRENERVANEQLAMLRALTSENEATREGKDKERLELLSREHLRAIETLTAQHGASYKELKSKFDEKEGLVLKLQKAVSSLNSEIEGLNSTSATQKTTLHDFHARVQELTESKHQLEVELRSVKDTAASLGETIAQKDSLIAILQQQLVELAENNLQSLDAAAFRAFDQTGGSDAEEGQQMNSSRRPINSENSKPVDSFPSSTFSPSVPAGQGPTSVQSDGASQRGLKGGGTSEGNNPSSQTVADPWQKLVDETGTSYYYNSETGASSWEIPPSRSASAPVAVTIGDWILQFDQNGSEYWLNQVTGESQWEAPSAVVAETVEGGGGDVEGGYEIEL